MKNIKSKNKLLIILSVVLILIITVFLISNNSKTNTNTISNENTINITVEEQKAPTTSASFNDYSNCPCPKHAKDLLYLTENYSKEEIDEVSEDKLMIYAYGETSEAYIIWKRSVKYSNNNEEFPASLIDETISRWSRLLLIGPDDYQIDTTIHKREEIDYSRFSKTLNGPVFISDIDGYTLDWDRSYAGYKQIISEFENYLNEYSFNSSYNVKVSNFYHDVKSYYDLLISNLEKDFDSNGDWLTNSIHVPNTPHSKNSDFYESEDFKRVVKNFLSEEFFIEIYNTDLEHKVNNYNNIYLDRNSFYRPHTLLWERYRYADITEDEEEWKMYLTFIIGGAYNDYTGGTNTMIVTRNYDTKTFLNQVEVYYKYDEMIFSDNELFNKLSKVDNKAIGFRKITRYETSKAGNKISDNIFGNFDIILDHDICNISYSYWAYHIDGSITEVIVGNEMVDNYDLINDFDAYEKYYFSNNEESEYNTCLLHHSSTYCVSHNSIEETTIENWAEYLEMDVEDLEVIE